MTVHKTPTLETARLILRPVTLADVSEVQRLFGQWDIVKFIGPAPWPYPEDGALTFYTDMQLPQMERGETFGFGITDKQVGTFMGAIDLRHKPDHIGFWLGQPFHGKGIMSEAVTAIIDYAFDVIGLPVLNVCNAQENIASHAIQAKTGASLISIDESKYAGIVKPQENWELTPEAWRASPMKAAAANPSYRVIG